MMEENPNSFMHNNSTTFNSSRARPTKNVQQSLEIEKLRLDFLHKCKYRKRPPQSLRLNGCNGLPFLQKIQLISKTENEILLRAIKNKQVEINRLQEQYSSHRNKSTMKGLDKMQLRNWKLHYNKKLQFYKKQEEAKWKFWPAKTKKQRRTKGHDRKKRYIIKRSQQILESKQVINLTNFPIPPEAVVVLNKGLGFVPTPKKVDIEELRLDTRQFTNRVALHAINSQREEEEETFTPSLPSKLKNISYKIIKPPTTDARTNNLINNITNRVDSIKPGQKPEKNMNLSKHELEGLTWLQEKTSNMEIIVDKADKGGAIIIYPPDLAEKKIAEKVTDKKLYVRMDTDPSEKIYDKLIDIWRNGRRKDFVTEEEASKVVGLTNNNQKSTASIYKPGDTYFNPSLKIHKMNIDEIKPGCDPPARLITCLQDGVTSRSDIFIAGKWLKPLQEQFCQDIVQDSIDVLNWLNDLDKMPEERKKSFKPFTFDFASLI